MSASLMRAIIACRYWDCVTQFVNVVVPFSQIVAPLPTFQKTKLWSALAYFAPSAEITCDSVIWRPSESESCTELPVVVEVVAFIKTALMDLPAAQVYIASMIFWVLAVWLLLWRKQQAERMPNTYTKAIGDTTTRADDQ